MTEDNELKYTQKDLDFFSDNADEYFQMANEARRKVGELALLVVELRNALSLERGGGTPLSTRDYLDLHKRSKVAVEGIELP
jgi:hypothetical protein